MQDNPAISGADSTAGEFVCSSSTLVWTCTLVWTLGDSRIAKDKAYAPQNCSMDGYDCAHACGIGFLMEWQMCTPWKSSMVLCSSQVCSQAVKWVR